MEEEDYEPYDHRQVKHPISNFEALAHFLKGALGTGILALPSAFAKLGMWLSIALTLVLGYLVTLSLHILFGSQYKTCKIRKVAYLNYGECFEVALLEGPSCFHKFAPYAKKLISIMLIIYQTGTCIIYIVFIGENIKAFFDRWSEKLTVEIYLLFLFFPFLGVTMIKSLKKFTPLSHIANFITLVTFCIVLYYVFQDLPSFDSRPAWKTPSYIPEFIGTMFFSLHSLATVIITEADMKDPRYFRKWYGTLNISMLFLTIFYVLFAIFGYWKYGDEARGSITLNMPREDFAVSFCTFFYAIAIYISYGLHAFVPRDEIWFTFIKKRVENEPTADLWMLFLMISLVAFTYVIAVSVPCLSPCISLNGAFNLGILAVVIPVIIDFCLNYKKWGIWVLRDIVLLAVGILVLSVGVGQAIYHIVICVQAKH